MRWNWESRVVGVTTPRSLQNAAFLTIGKVFSLRGGVEHCSLKVSQLKRTTSPDQYTYSENVSKTCNGSFKQLHVKSKVVPVFACPEAGEMCPVNILDLYLSKLPKEGTQDVFYLCPLKKDTTGSFSTIVCFSNRTQKNEHNVQLPGV